MKTELTQIAVFVEELFLRSLSCEFREKSELDLYLWV